MLDTPTRKLRRVLGLWFKASLGLLAPLVVGAGCGGATTVGVDTPVTATQACSDLAEARCTKRQVCSNGSDLIRVWGDMTTCLAREALSCMDGVTATMTGQSPALIEQCATQMASYACADFFDGNLPGTCNPSGPGAIGAPCAFNGQCASAYCSGTRYAICGTCAAPPAAGASCTTSNCGHDAECVWDVDTVNVCEPFAASGGACGYYADPACAADLTCTGATTEAPGTCAAATGTAGAPCGEGCDNTLGLRCTGPTNAETCTEMTYAGDGAPCGTVTPGDPVVECTAGVCYSTGGPYTSSTLPTGTCKAYASDGSPCDTQAGPQCLSPARCITSGGATAGVCTVPTAAVAAACN